MPVSTLPAAAIFDMDGVLVDSNPFHLRKWEELLNERKIPYDLAQLPQQILGKRNDDAFRLFFGQEMTKEQRQQLGEELEAQFRKSFGPHVQPLPGSRTLLTEIQAAGIPMAVASSAMRPNIEFVIDMLGFRPFFRILMSGDDVRAPKPDPEIYLKTATELGVAPAASVAFEDSFPGVQAAKAAGMKCVAIASTFPIDGLRDQTPADLVVSSFTELSLARLQRLFAV
jgi:beta-phosphoglucomutase